MSAPININRTVPASASSTSPRASLPPPGSSPSPSPSPSNIASVAKKPEFELLDDVSEPFFKGLGVVFVDVVAIAAGGQANRCDLCSFASKNPLPSWSTPVNPSHEQRWGVLRDVLKNKVCCKEKKEEDQHAFHYRCIRSYVLAKKSQFRENPTCPSCPRSNFLPPPSAANPYPTKAPGSSIPKDQLEQKYNQTPAKSQKLYTCWVHIIRANNIRLPSAKDRELATPSPTPMLNRSPSPSSLFGTPTSAAATAASIAARGTKPRVYVSAFDQTWSTKPVDFTFSTTGNNSAYWNETTSFQKRMTEDELKTSGIQIRVEDDTNIWPKQPLGLTGLRCQAIYNQKEGRELYQLRCPLQLTGPRPRLHGELQVSVCILSEDDMKANPKLPLHVYDLEVARWEELRAKGEIFDMTSKNLTTVTNKTVYDVVRINVYHAENVPQMDQSTWCNAFMEMDYPGYTAAAQASAAAANKPNPVIQPFRTPIIRGSSTPVFNSSFTIPVPRNKPLAYPTFDLKLCHSTAPPPKKHEETEHEEETKEQQAQAIRSDEKVDVAWARLNLHDCLRLPENSPPVWKSLYHDLEGQSPRYHGRVLIEVTVEREVTKVEYGVTPIPEIKPAFVPPTGSYRFDVELFEGQGLAGDADSYEVHVTLGHTVMGLPEDRAQHGRCWLTFESESNNFSSEFINFGTRKSVLLHDLPVAREEGGSAQRAVWLQRQSSHVGPTPTSIPRTDILKQTFAPDASAGGFRGSAASLPSGTSPDPQFSADSLLLDHASAIPDIIIYVNCKTGAKQGVGYLRIPVNALRRPTAVYPHGSDFAVYPNILNNLLASPQVFPLRPLSGKWGVDVGSLLLKLNLTPVSASTVDAFKQQNGENGEAVTPLPALIRDKYQLIARVYQGKDVASVQNKALSSPLLALKVGRELLFTSPPTRPTTAPNWFESLVMTVDLPRNLAYAPDIQLLAFHRPESEISKKPATSLLQAKDMFLGKVSIPTLQAIDHPSLRIVSDEQPQRSEEDGFSSTPAWYPLRFEQHQHGYVLLAFSLQPLISLTATQAGRKSGSIVKEATKHWDEYSIDVSSLEVQGALATKYRLRKMSPSFEIESTPFGHVVNQGQRDKRKVTVALRKPNSDVFYSAIHVRVMEGAASGSQEVAALASIPIQTLLNSASRWFQLIELLTRDESWTARRVIRRWRNYIANKEYDASGVKTAKPLRISNLQVARSPSKTKDSLIQEAGQIKVIRTRDGRGSISDRLSPVLVDQQPRVTELSPLLSQSRRSPDSYADDVRLNVHEEWKETSGDLSMDTFDSPSSVGSSSSSSYSSRSAPSTLEQALRPRLLDEKGNEVFSERELQYLHAQQLAGRDPGLLFESHPRLKSEWELVASRASSLVDPFTTAGLFNPTEKASHTFMSKLSVLSKKQLGTLRGRFLVYKTPQQQMGGIMDIADLNRPGAPVQADADFDSERFYAPQEYAVRVYVIQAAELSTIRDLPKACDAFVTLSIPGHKQQKSTVVEGTFNPVFNQSFDFVPLKFPSTDFANQSLNLSVWNENTPLLPELIGSTEISLEGRLFSRSWNRANVKPVETRALKQSSTATLSRGSLQMCIQVVPIADINRRSLDYLLKPLVYSHWELRVTVWNAKNIKLKDSPANLFLVTGLSGDGATASPSHPRITPKPQMSDVHPHSFGEGQFNRRFIFPDIELPLPESMTFLKLQLWSQSPSQTRDFENKPDFALDYSTQPLDPKYCLGEAIVPMWGFLEHARRAAERAGAHTAAAYLIQNAARQSVQLFRVRTPNAKLNAAAAAAVPAEFAGDVELSVELLPHHVAQSKEHRAAGGANAFNPALNAPLSVLPTPHRPVDPLYKYKAAWSKWKKIVFALLLIVLIVGVIGGLWYYHESSASSSSSNGSNATTQSSSSTSSPSTSAASKKLFADPL